MANRTPGQRAGLTSEAVVSAARVLADRDGLERLSMRSLAAELGVMPNALYSHVGGKEALLDALLDDVLDLVETPRGGDWRESLLGVLDSTRRVLVEHPGLIGGFLTRPTRGPNALRLGEFCLERLAQGGIEGERAVRAFRALLIFTLGFSAYEEPRAHDPDPGAREAASAEAFGTSGHRRSEQAARELSRMPHEDDFHAALGWMLDGVLADSEPRAQAK